MGSGQSNTSRLARHSGSESSPGLLRLSNLVNRHYPFENLVFEGCGARGLAYVGAVKVLEKIGVLSNIKRFAGVGTGAVVACLLATGMDCYSMQESLNQHLENLLADNRCSNEVLLDELLHNFGWNSGDKFLDWFGSLLEEQCNNADITFQELYFRTGKELCVVAMNLNRMREEYFHPKTTPNISVRRAVLMSISIPGILRPVKFSLNEPTQDFYLDGGILCNYPIHCFDGWWLSMKTGKKVCYKSQTIADLKASIRGRFAEFNIKTIGFTLFDEYHRYDNLLYSVMKRRLDHTRAVIPIPATELGRKYVDRLIKEEELKQSLDIFPEALKKLKTLLDAIKERDNLVSIEKLEEKLTSEDSKFTSSDIEALFGVEKSEEKRIEILQKNAGDQKMLSIPAIMNIIEKISRYLYNPNKLTPRTEVTSLPSFWGTINSAVHGNSKLASNDDLQRTVGIYTGHITNNDVELEESDEVYLFQHGWNCTVAFLHGLHVPSAYVGVVSSSTQTLYEISNSSNSFSSSSIPSVTVTI